MKEIQLSKSTELIIINYIWIVASFPQSYLNRYYKSLEMEIKILKAGTGDSILIHHNNFNIIVDGGNDSKYLLNEVNEIYKKDESIDLLIVTHHDDDHIKGIIDLLKCIINGDFGDKKNFIKRVIFNSPRIILGKIVPKKDRLISYKQAHELEELLLKTQVNWEKFTNKNEPISFADLQIDFLSPYEEDLEEYVDDKRVYLSSDFKCDWKSPMQLLESYLHDKSQDKSVSNKSSVVVKIECENKKILLTGDVTPNRLELIINKLVEENGNNLAYFDYIKLPHHGSYRSLNKRIIEKIKCHNYIISTNGNKHFLPNKRSLLKLLKFLNRDKEKVNFIFNYEETLDKLEITEQEKKHYNFSIIPNNQKYGISI
ncbi:MBL fold metallo-hydrolase [Flavobacterium sp. CAU 1735]|uniref:MBL fold metallo-hydrolase n=1 Tax=Flavobacterium sp. CAU 1735 TaxID=3140361 RepID=UPI003261195A